MFFQYLGRLMLYLLTGDVSISLWYLWGRKCSAIVCCIRTCGTACQSETSQHKTKHSRSPWQLYVRCERERGVLNTNHVQSERKCWCSLQWQRHELFIKAKTGRRRLPLALLRSRVCFFRASPSGVWRNKKKKPYRIKTQTKVQSSSDQVFFTWGYRSPGKPVWRLRPRQAPSRSKKETGGRNSAVFFFFFLRLGSLVRTLPRSIG